MSGTLEALLRHRADVAAELRSILLRENGAGAIADDLFNALQDVDHQLRQLDQAGQPRTYDDPLMFADHDESERKAPRADANAIRAEDEAERAILSASSENPFAWTGSPPGARIPGELGVGATDPDNGSAGDHLGRQHGS